MNVQGHAALVTGGASGLGEGTARALTAAGAKVAILDVNLEGARRVAADIGGLAVQCDVSSAAAAEGAASARPALGRMALTSWAPFESFTGGGARPGLPPWAS